MKNKTKKWHKVLLWGMALAFSTAETVNANEVEDRAERNRQIISCYAAAAKVAYRDTSNLIDICGPLNHGAPISPHAGLSSDHRNGMEGWWPSSNQPPHHHDVIKFFERENGNRRELLIAYRGSSVIGDFIQDAKSQVFVAHNTSDVAFGSIGFAEGDPKIHAGFFARVENTASEVLTKLEEMEAWLAGNSNRRLGIKVTGHSLGAAASTIASYYLAHRYFNNDRVDVEAFAFNSPIVGNADFALDIYSLASSCDFNLHIINNQDDLVSYVPAKNGGTAIDFITGPRDEPLECSYVKGLRVHNPIHGWAVLLGPVRRWFYHYVSQWYYDVDPGGYNTQHRINDDQMASLFPTRDIGSASPQARSLVSLVDLNSVPGGHALSYPKWREATSDIILNYGTYLDIFDHDSEIWHHSVVMNKGETWPYSSVWTYGGNGYRVGFEYGRLRVYQGSQQLWSSPSGNRLEFQSDGDLVLYNNNTITWSTNTGDTTADHLTITDAGHLVMMDENGYVVERIFEAPTGCPPSVCFDDGFE